MLNFPKLNILQWTWRSVSQPALLLGIKYQELTLSICRQFPALHTHLPSACKHLEWKSPGVSQWQEKCKQRVGWDTWVPKQPSQGGEGGSQHLSFSWYASAQQGPCRHKGFIPETDRQPRNGTLRRSVPCTGEPEPKSILPVRGPCSQGTVIVAEVV